MTCARLDRLFGDLRTWLPGLVQQVQARQAAEPVMQPAGAVPGRGRAAALCEQVMELLGFDFKAGPARRQHPSVRGGVPEDVRMTTRFATGEFITSLMGAIHETGHGRYEQNRPRLAGPAGVAGALDGLHESQSLSFEMQLGSHPGFLAQLAPLISRPSATSRPSSRRTCTAWSPGSSRA
jgi:carboxypeptidase Taq